MVLKSSESKKVLVVDDEQEVTFALHGYFMGKGYEMLTALDGMQAMRLLHQHEVDLVLLDMKMPGVNGIEVLKFIHSHSRKTRVIVVTAYDDQFQEMVEKLGVDGFLIKPFGIEALTATIERVLSGQQVSDTVPVQPESTESLRGPKARAKLLFVEPSEYTYKLKEVFFSDSDKCGGFYEISPAYSMEEVLKLLVSFKPDIVLVDLSMLGAGGEVPLKVMMSPSKPKELIIHGSNSALPVSRNVQVEDLTRQGVKVIYNESFTRAGLIRLADVIRKTAITHGLVEVAG
ncbi:MAG: response regulator [Candidatus Omnitrophica bacterium]|nr:response regulator [Candidatus Omnitrophota bacterium]